MDTNDTHHEQLAQLLFNHALALIDANDKRYLGLFVTHEDATKSHSAITDMSRSEMIRAVDVLRDSYLVGHLDVVKKIEALQSVVDNSKGSVTGISSFTGWVLAFITVITALSVHFFDTSKPPVSAQSILNGQSLEQLKKQVEENRLYLRDELVKHDVNTSKECKP